MEKPKNIQMENYVFMEQDEIQLLYPLSFSEEEIKDYTDYLDTILAENSKVKILTEELSISLFLYLQDKSVTWY